MTVFDRIRAFPGDVGFYFRRLGGAEEPLLHNPDLPLIAASVIKIPIMVAAFREAGRGELNLSETVAIRPEMKMPSCGALTYLHDGLEVTLEDLVTLMIILSDNTATNILIDRLGMENVNAGMRALGLEKSTLRRLLFDSEASARGLENTITAEEMGQLLEKLFKGECVSPAADAEMLSILRDQRLNGKIPFFLDDMEIAHKTGEDDGITHDVGIVYADSPLILCFASNHTNVPAFERFIQDAARDFVQWV